MEQLIRIWKDVWDEEFDDNQNYQRYFRLIEDILKEINKNGDESFIKDTFAISRSLNVVAKKLYFEGLKLDSLEHLRLLGSKVSYNEMLNTMNRLSKSDAQQIVKKARKKLQLDGLTQLSTDLAKALARFKGKDLHLNGIKSLSHSASIELVKGCHTGLSLSLNGIEQVAPEVIRTLAQCSYTTLSLNGIRRLTPELAQALSEVRAKSLMLNGLNDLDSVTGSHLAKIKTNTLSLDGLKAISPQLAKALSHYKDHLTLLGIDHLVPEAAQIFMEQRPKKLSINFKNLNHETVKLMTELHPNRLDFKSLEEIDSKSALAFSDYQGDLIFSKLKRLDSLSAQALAKSKAKSIRFEKLKHIALKDLFLLYPVAKKSPIFYEKIFGALELDEEIADFLLKLNQRSLVLPNVLKFRGNALQKIIQF